MSTLPAPAARLPTLRLKAVVLCGAVLLCQAALLGRTAEAALSTYLEPRLVEEMDTVRLVIRAEGTNQAEAPDLTPLMPDFEVLGNQTSSRLVTGLNGRTLASVEYQITLRPRRTGELVVPSLTIGTEQTEALTLMVRPLDPALKRDIARMVFFETELSHNPVYVQAETVLTRRLFYSQGVQIYSDLPGLPEVANAVVLALGETQSRSVLRHGQRYGVIEQRYAVFPEQSGTLRIPSISVTSSVRLQTSGRTRRSGIRVSTEEIDLQVLPIPAAYPAGAPWLPATDVSLEQAWAPSVTSVDVGDPLTYQLTVAARGNRGSAIPPVGLPLPDDRFKVYPEAPVMTERTDTDTVIGQRTETFALIPTRPGRVTVPAVGITWWDTSADRLRRTSFDIAPMLITGTLPTPPADPATREPQPAPAAAEPTRVPANASGTPWGLLAAMSLVALLLVAALIRTLRPSLPRLPWSGRRAPREPSGRALARRLRRSAASGDVRGFRADLVRYLAARYRTSEAAAMAQFRRWPGAAPLLTTLDRAVYAGPTGTGEHPDLPSLAELAGAATATARARPGDRALPPLYG